MGSEETQTIGFQDEAKQNEKKRTQGNKALEDRKEELKRNKESTNMSDDEDDNDRNFSIKKRGFICNTPTHLQIIPLIQVLQDGQYYPQSGSASQTNVSYARPKKYLLDFVLDVLQRSDPDELFAKPINPDGGNKPLDFATIRAKINKEHYMSMDSFKFDVYRLCFSAMYYNDKDSRHYQVAEALHSLAKKVFEDISVVCLQQINFESLPKKTPLEAPSGIPRVGKQKTIGHARFRHTLLENNIGSPSIELERDKRDNQFPVLSYESPIILPNIPKTKITPQVVEPSIAQAATSLDDEQFLMLCFGDSSSHVSNNVSDVQSNPHASGIQIPKQENLIPCVASLLNYQDKRESNKNGGGRQHNSSITIPRFLENNVASSSKNIGVVACSSQMGVWPSQDSNFARRDNYANNSFFSQSDQYGSFQGLAYPMGPFPMIQHSISSSSPIPTSNNVKTGNLNKSEGEGRKKEKDGKGTGTNDGKIEELDLDLKL